MPTPASILIVEDENTISLVLKSTLESLGHSVASVNTGEAAVASASNTAFDLIVLDIMIPGTNGIDALREIRKRKIPSKVLVVSALGTGETEKLAREAGANDYVAKPFTSSEFLERVHSLLG